MRITDDDLGFSANPIRCQDSRRCADGHNSFAATGNVFHYFRSRRIAALGVFVACITYAYPTFSATPPAACRRDLLATANQAPEPNYPIRRGDVYCDGLVALQLGADIELIGLGIGRVEYSMSDTSLHIPGPGGGSNEVVAIQGLDRGSRTRRASSYRLDGTLGSTGLDVLIAPAIRAIGIAPSELALVAKSNAGTVEEYLPIVAMQHSPTDPLIATIRVPVAAIRMFAQWCISSQNVCSARKLIREQIARGESIDVEIPRTNGAMRVQLQIDLEAAFGATFSNTYTIIVSRMS